MRASTAYIILYFGEAGPGFLTLCLRYLSDVPYCINTPRRIVKNPCTGLLYPFLYSMVKNYRQISTFLQFYSFHIRRKNIDISLKRFWISRFSSVIFFFMLFSSLTYLIPKIYPVILVPKILNFVFTKQSHKKLLKFVFIFSYRLPFLQSKNQDEFCNFNCLIF